MSEPICITLNAQTVFVEPGTTVAVALTVAGIPSRISVTGTPRGALCGMGICYECRALVDGVLHRRTCQLACQPGMEIHTQ